MNVIEQAKAHPVISLLFWTAAVAGSAGAIVSTYYTHREAFEASIAKKVVDEFKPDVDALKAEIKAFKEEAQSANRSPTERDLAFGYFDSGQNLPLYNYPPKGSFSGKNRSYSSSSSNDHAPSGSFNIKR